MILQGTTLRSTRNTGCNSIGSSLFTRPPTVLNKSVFVHTDMCTGPIVRLAPNRYSINDPDGIKTILGHSPAMAKSQYYHPFGRHDETNLFSETDKASHSKMRRPISQLYSNTHLLSYEAQVNKCNVVLLKSMREFVRERKAIDFRVWSQYYAFDVIGQISVRTSRRCHVVMNKLLIASSWITVRILL